MPTAFRAKDVSLRIILYDKGFKVKSGMACVVSPKPHIHIYCKRMKLRLKNVFSDMFALNKTLNN